MGVNGSTEYKVTMESMEETYPELEPLYKQHYEEMTVRMAECGIDISPYNPRKDAYFKAGNGGWLLTFVLRFKGEAVGYCNIYITHDMHNYDLIAQEDTIYVIPEHRNGAGGVLVDATHDELRKRKVKRASVTTSTDLRVAKWLERKGYKHTAHHMTINF